MSLRFKQGKSSSAEAAVITMAALSPDARARPKKAAPKARISRARIVKLLPKVVLSGLLIGPLIFLLLNISPGRQFVEPRNSMLLLRLSLIYSGFGALMSLSFFLTCALPSMYLAATLQDYPKGIVLPLKITTAFAGGVLGFVLPSVLLNYFFGIQLIGRETLRVVLIVDGIFSVTLGLLISAFAKLRAEVSRQERLLYESQLTERVLAEQTATAQLRALQAQINPHFFFNTLSSISALLNTDSVAAKAMIVRLAAMYRYTLRCTTTQLVSLEDEIEFVKSYLRIEEIRFRNRLTVEIATPPQLSDLKLPGLILQPLAENAVKHGIAKNIGPGVINIRVERDAQSFTIIVCNTAEQSPDLRPAQLFMEGHALQNVTERLRAIYGAAHEFNITSCKDHVRVSLKFPLHSALTP